MPGKHVIFLGAGASISSGFPAAYDLTLRMISRKHRDDHCYKLFQRHFFQEGSEFISNMQVAVDFFAKGCFASVDEFCKLATDSPAFRGYVPQLKQLMRLILSIDNPVENFETDYRAFVNRLISKDGVTLRDDISILSYNYDTHLDYLLAEAVNTRHRVKTSDPSSYAPIEVLDSVTSGLWSQGQSNWKDNSGFCLLKLHGALAYPNGKNSDIIWNDLFDGTYEHRIKRLSNSNYHVPCIFPWEMLKGNDFLDPASFCLRHQRTGCPKDVYTLFRDTWERARDEVTQAEKISFVGMSMHHFLEEGLRFLFSRRKYPPSVVYSVSHGNRNTHPKSGKAVDAFDTPAWRTAWFFRKSFKEWTVSPQNPRPWDGGVKLETRVSFQEFIEKNI